MSKRKNMVTTVTAGLNQGQGIDGLRQRANPDAGEAHNGLTSVPPRVTAGYKIDADVKRNFAAFVRWLNRDWKAEDRQEIGIIAEAALVEYMDRHGWANGVPPHEGASDADRNV